MFAGMVCLSPSFFHVNGLDHSSLNTWFLRTCSLPFFPLRISSFPFVVCMQVGLEISSLCQAPKLHCHIYCPEISILLDLWVDYLLGHAIDE